MKNKTSLIASLLLMIVVAGCSFNYSETGMKVDMAKDGRELALAKKSLEFVDAQQPDSLKALINRRVWENSTPDQIAWLLKNGNRIMERNAYPADSMITVSRKTTKTALGESMIKEFSFPFVNNDTVNKAYQKMQSR